MHGIFHAPYIGGEPGYRESTATDLWLVVGCRCWFGCQVVHSLVGMLCQFFMFDSHWLVGHVLCSGDILVLVLACIVHADMFWCILVVGVVMHHLLGLESLCG